MREKSRFRAIGLGCVVLSVAPVIYAWRWNDPDVAGLGGTLALAIALSIMFSLRNYASDVYEALATRAPARDTEIDDLAGNAPASAAHPSAAEQRMARLESEVRDARSQLAGLRQMLRFSAEGQDLQNFWLAVATATGTVFSGFGETLAKWLIRLSH